MTLPAVEIHGMSKRYLGSGSLVPLPHKWGASRLERGRRDEEVVDIDDDTEIDEDEPEDEPVEAHAEEVWALRDVSLAVAPGTLLAIIGPDGSGKSTLMRILGRTASPTSGYAILRGRVAPLLRIVPGLMRRGEPGRENVLHVASFYGVPRAEAAGYIDEIARFSELGDKIERDVRTYSTGEMQRFAFAIALGFQPDVLLADEVVTAGDLHFRNRCLDHIERRSADGLTLMFASHNIALVRRLCTEAILLDAGRIVARGPVEEVVAQYERGSSSTRARGAGAGPEDELEDLADDRLGPLTSVGIYASTGKPTDLLQVDEESLVELVLDVDEAPVTLRCVLRLESPAGVARSVQPQAFTIDAPGRRYVSVRLPPGSLPVGSVQGRVGITASTDSGRELVSRTDNAFAVEVLGEDEPSELGPAAARRTQKRNLALGWRVSER